MRYDTMRFDSIRLDSIWYDTYMTYLDVMRLCVCITRINARYHERFADWYLKKAELKGRERERDAREDEMLATTSL